MSLHYFTMIASNTGQIHVCFLDKHGGPVEIIMNGPEAIKLSQELLILADSYYRNLKNNKQQAEAQGKIKIGEE